MKQKVAADSLNITFLKANPISILWYDTVVVEMLVQVWRYFLLSNRYNRHYNKGANNL